MKRLPLCDILRTINPEDLDWHAARYESARHFRRAVALAHEDAHSDTIASALHEALEATREDGGTYGEIPNLGARWQRVFDAATANIT